MVERITDPHIPGGMTFPGGRIPDGHTVPQPPRPQPPAPPAQPPVSRRQVAYGWACVAIAAGAVVVRQVTS